jgi:hypothetical protein
MWRTIAVLFFGAGALLAEKPAHWTTLLGEHAACFERNASQVTTVETLVQRTYDLPPHSRFAIGPAAGPLRAQYLIREIVSEYSVAPLRPGGFETVVELREPLSIDGRVAQARETARIALAREAQGSETALRKRMLQKLERLGLKDIATEYALILLAFTPAAQKRIEWSETREAFVGTEEAVVFEWRQTAGGALAFMKNKATEQPMRGSIWARKSDGAPLRVRAVIDYAVSGRAIRDEASIEYVDSKALRCVAPVSAVHRHWVGDALLTENLFTYEPFRLFTTDTKIQYEPETRKK